MVSDWYSEVFSQQKSDIAKLVFCNYHHLITLFITTFIADFGLGREPSVILNVVILKFYLVFLYILLFRIFDNIRNFK